MAVVLTPAGPANPAFSSRPRLVRRLSALAAGQGLFYLATGIWPLVHVDSFQAVTGPKTDLWLVYTVGVLVAVVGAVLLAAARRRHFPPELALLAGGTAAGLAGIDVVFVARGVIRGVYLLDAAVEVLLALGWAAAVLLPMAGARTPRG